MKKQKRITCGFIGSTGIPRTIMIARATKSIRNTRKNVNGRKRLAKTRTTVNFLEIMRIKKNVKKKRKFRKMPKPVVIRIGKVL